jgi:hypothetical protein
VAAYKAGATKEDNSAAGFQAGCFHD